MTSAEDQANQAVAPLNSIKSVSFYSLIGAVIAGSVIVLMAMVMIVRERRREIGILKAIGASNLRVIFQFMSEALTFTILGAVIGLLIGVAAGGPVTQALVSNTNTSVTTSTTSGAGPVTRFGGRSGGGGGGFFRQNFGLSSIGSNLKNIKADIGLDLLAYGFGAAIVIAISRQRLSRLDDRTSQAVRSNEDRIMLKVVKVTKEFPSGDGRVTAVDNVSFEVADGKFVSIIGKSGSGKTTLLSLIGTLEKPSRGDIEIAGNNVSRMSDHNLTTYRRKRIGFVFQGYNLIPNLTAAWKTSCCR